MKLDDRFMTILTALLVLVGIGALLSRGEDGEGVFGGSDVYDAKPDTYSLRAGRVQALEVLLNDTGTELIDPEALSIVTGPTCGLAMVVDGAIQYSETADCEGDYELTYGVPFNGEVSEAVVSLRIINIERQHQEAIAAAKARGNSSGTAAGPSIQTEVSEGKAPRDNLEIAAQRPVRLEIPSTAEVITPQEATEAIRNRDVASAVAVQSTTNIEGLTSSNVTVSRDSARTGSVATSGVTLGAPAPDFETSDIQISSASSTPAAPRRAGAPGGLGSTPSIAAPSLPNSVTELASSSALPPVNAEAQTETEQPEAPRPAETELAGLAPEPAPAPAPAPVEAEADVEIETETAAAPALPAAAPVAQTIDPVVARVETAPENSGVLSTIARTNSVLGATVSVARALFSPSADETESRVGLTDTRSAPQPSGLAISEVLNGGSVDFASVGNANVPRPAGQDTSPSTLGGAPVLIAALRSPADIEISTRPAALPEPAEGTELAALPPSTEGEATTPDVAAPVATCDVGLLLTSRSGAEIVANVDSSCRPDSLFTVSHAGLEFSDTTDASGAAEIVIPALRSDAEVSVSFADGATAQASTSVNGLDGLIRVAVHWSADIDFDLHALEFGAREGTEGHVWAGNAGSYRDARRSGTGYLTQLGPEDGEGARAEVYTLVENSRTPGGLVDLSLELAAFGAVCEDRPVVRTLRVEFGAPQRDSDIQFDLSGCGSPESVFIPNTLQDVRVDRR